LVDTNEMGDAAPCSRKLNSQETCNTRLLFVGHAQPPVCRAPPSFREARQLLMQESRILGIMTRATHQSPTTKVRDQRPHALQRAVWATTAHPIPSQTSAATSTRGSACSTTKTRRREREGGEREAPPRSPRAPCGSPR